MRIFDRLYQPPQEPEYTKEPSTTKNHFWLQFKNRRTLYIRLFILIVCFSVLPCLIIGFWANHYINNTVFNRYLNEYLDGVYRMVQTDLNHYIEQITAFPAYAFSDGKVFSVCINNSLTTEEKAERIRPLLTRYLREDGPIANLDIVLPSGERIRQHEEEITGIDLSFSKNLKHTNTTLYDRLVQNKTGTRYWVFATRVFTMSTNAVQFDLYLYVPEHRIYHLLSELNSKDNTFFLTVNNTVMSHRSKNHLGQYVIFPETNTDQIPVRSDRSGEYLYDSHPIDFTIAANGRWLVQSRMSYRWLYKEMEMLQFETTAMAIFAILIALLLALFIPFSMLRSISVLQNQMLRFVSSDIATRKSPEFSFRETAALEHSFNEMVSEINQLIERNNIEKEKQRRAELSALQAQINPHFIYNALDAISWYAKIEKQHYLSNMVCELANFFRISLHKGENLIKVREEISHVESYIAIEQMRFPDVFSVEYKIQEDLLEEKMLKIIFQPIVENSIKHGFENIDNGGKISIVGYRDDSDDIVFEISDNGHGMDFDPLKTETEHKKGYGIKNVNERIRLEYGDGYGLTYLSTPDEGTTVIVRLKTLPQQ
ncbi:MAG: sensor histidine kinase [Ruminococcaceae bacterium]|nr:sensor histidine kinase [Oscillospiraceae bacterium]